MPSSPAAFAARSRSNGSVTESWECRRGGVWRGDVLSRVPPGGGHPPGWAGRIHPRTRPGGGAGGRQGVNEPTAEGIAGADEMLRLLGSAGHDDVAVCLLSGGGSALLPAPAEGVTLSCKQAVTKLLHRCGATINEMNCVRKHLSRVKGGRLAGAFRGKRGVSLIISGVIGEP